MKLKLGDPNGVVDIAGRFSVSEGPVTVVARTRRGSPTVSCNGVAPLCSVRTTTGIARTPTPGGPHGRRGHNRRW